MFLLFFVFVFVLICQSEGKLSQRFRDTLSNYNNLKDIADGNANISPKYLENIDTSRRSINNYPSMVKSGVYHSDFYKKAMKIMTQEKIDNFKEAQKQNNQRRDVGNTFDTIIVGTGAGGLSVGASLLTYAPIFAPGGYNIAMFDHSNKLSGCFREKNTLIPYWEDDEYEEFNAPLAQGFQAIPNIPGIDVLFDEMLLTAPGTFALESLENPAYVLMQPGKNILLRGDYFLNTTGTSTLEEAIARSLEIALGLRVGNLIDASFNLGYYDQVNNIITYMNDIVEELFYGEYATYHGYYAKDYFEERFNGLFPLDLMEIIIDIAIDELPNSVKGVYMANLAIMEMFYAIGPTSDYKGSIRKVRIALEERVRDYGATIKKQYEVDRVLFENPSNPLKATGIVARRKLGSSGSYGEEETFYADNVVLAIHVDNIFKPGFLPEVVLNASGYADYYNDEWVWGDSVMEVDLTFSASFETIGFDRTYVRMVSNPVVFLDDIKNSTRPVIGECTKDSFHGKNAIPSSMLQTDLVGDKELAYLTLATSVPASWFTEWFESEEHEDIYAHKRWVEECVVPAMLEALYSIYPDAEDYYTGYRVLTPVDLYKEFGFVNGAAGQAPPEIRIVNPVDTCTNFNGTTGLYVTGGARDIGVALAGSSGLMTALIIFGETVNCEFL